MNNEVYHSCRWCKWVNNGRCTNKVLTVDQIEIFPFYEDGTLSEAIREGFGKEQFKKLKIALEDSKLSKKKQNEILRVFLNELDDTVIDWIEEIDGKVSTALNHFDFEIKEGINITDPNNFYCKSFICVKKVQGEGEGSRWVQCEGSR